MKIRILFYKSKFGDGHWIDNAISMWTGIWNWFTKNYAHCEVWIPDGPFFGKSVSQVLCPQDAGFCGTTYTSTMRGENDGVVERSASEVLKNPSRWDYYEIEINEAAYQEMIYNMDFEVNNNKGYDKPSIVKFFNPFSRKPTLEKFICSEFVHWSLFCANIFCKPELLSPRRLSKRLEKLGYEAKSLCQP